MSRENKEKEKRGVCRYNIAFNWLIDFSYSLSPYDFIILDYSQYASNQANIKNGEEEKKATVMIVCGTFFFVFFCIRNQNENVTWMFANARYDEMVGRKPCMILFFLLFTLDWRRIDKEAKILIRFKWKYFQVCFHHNK